MKSRFNSSDFEQLPDGSFRMKKAGSSITLPKTGDAGLTVARNKHNARKNEYIGIWFDSKKEMCRFKELLFLQSIGEISFLNMQVKFKLSVCTYIADFVYLSHGELVIEDVKSPHTRKLPVYRIKCKMMFKERNITIKEF